MDFREVKFMASGDAMLENAQTTITTKKEGAIFRLTVEILTWHYRYLQLLRYMTSRNSAVVRRFPKQQTS
jgi:hypothetical protein